MKPTEERKPTDHAAQLEIRVDLQQLEGHKDSQEEDKDERR